MTTTLTPPEPTAAQPRPLRVLPIAADLLPAEIVQLRRDRRVRGAVLAGLALFALLIAGWYGLARYQTAAEHSTLATAEADAQRLVAEQHRYAEVVSVQAESAAITTQLSTLMDRDLSWSKLVGALHGRAPSGVAVTGVSGAITTTTVAGAQVNASGGLPDATGKQLVGTLVVTGTAADHGALAAYLDALDTTSGVGNTSLSGVVAQEGALQFTVQLDITAGSLGGRYGTATTGSGDR
jgi:Tfp pilus assembly protein PilN